MLNVPQKRITYILYTCMMLVVTVITFENLAHYDFWDGWDDWAVIADAEIMADDLSHMFSSNKHHKDVRPPVDLAFLLGYSLWQDDAVGFRMMQVTLHFFASLLLVYVLNKMGVDLELCLISGLLFLVNVAHFRALHWVMPTNYILAFIFSLLVLYCYWRFLMGDGRYWLAGSVGLFTIAIFSHPCAISAGLFCIYLAFWKTGAVRDGVRAAWLIALAIPCVIFLAFLASPTSSQNEGVLAAVDLSRLLINPFWYLGRLMTNAHWIFRGATGIEVQAWEVGVGALVFAGLIFVFLRNGFPVAGSAVWVMVSVLPFVNNAPERMAVGPSRHLYFASAGSSVLIAWAMREIVGNMLRQSSVKIKKYVYGSVILLLVVASIVFLKRSESLSIYFAGRGYDYRSDAQPQYLERAPELFHKALLHAPDLVPGDIYLRLVQAGLSVGQAYDEAIDEVLVDRPDDPELLMLKGVMGFLSDDIEVQTQSQMLVGKAFEMAEEKQDLRQNAAISIRNLGSYFHREGQLKRAVNLYRYALQLQPHYVATLTQLGQVLYQLGEREESVLVLQQAVELNPKSGAALQNLGTVLFMEGQLEQAIEAYKQAIKAVPGHAVLYFNLAVALRELGNISEAVLALEQAVKIKPGDIEMLLLLGPCYEALGQYKDAIRIYERCLVLTPQATEISERLDLLKQHHINR